MPKSKFEYHYGLYKDPVAVAKDAEGLGKDGWELIHLGNDYPHLTQTWFAIFKRKV